jgi:chromosome segregation ATPase
MAKDKAVDLNESLAELEQKLSKAVEVFKRAQSENRDLQRALEKLQGDSKDHDDRLDALRNEVQLLRREREDVRARLEKLLAQISLLTKSDSPS